MVIFTPDTPGTYYYFNPKTPGKGGKIEFLLKETFGKLELIKINTGDV